jgi:hypothetical protein
VALEADLPGRDRLHEAELLLPIRPLHHLRLGDGVDRFAARLAGLERLQHRGLPGIRRVVRVAHLQAGTGQVQARLLGLGGRDLRRDGVADADGVHRAARVHRGHQFPFQGVKEGLDRRLALVDVGLHLPAAMGVRGDTEGKRGDHGRDKQFLHDRSSLVNGLIR